MDALKNAFGSSNSTQPTSTEQPAQQQSGGGGLFGSVNNALGGGAQGEKNEDYLDKGVDFVQERMGQGAQNNESALEQAKDEQISDFIRGQYKGATGNEFPVADKS